MRIAMILFLCLTGCAATKNALAPVVAGAFAAESKITTGLIVADKAIQETVVSEQQALAWRKVRDEAFAGVKAFNAALVSLCKALGLTVTK